MKQVSAKSAQSGVANAGTDFSVADLDFNQVYAMLPMLQALP